MIIVMAVIYSAVRFVASRHLICRLRTKDARSSVLRETLIPWLEKTVETGTFTLYVHDVFVTPGTVRESGPEGWRTRNKKEERKPKAGEMNIPNSTPEGWEYQKRFLRFRKQDGFLLPGLGQQCDTESEGVIALMKRLPGCAETTYRHQQDITGWRIAEEYV